MLAAREKKKGQQRRASEQKADPNQREECCLRGTFLQKKSSRCVVSQRINEAQRAHSNETCHWFVTLFAEDLQRRHPSVESDESLGYHWGSWLGDGIQPLDGLTAGDEASSLEPSLLLSFAGESAASSPSVEQANGHGFTQCSTRHFLGFFFLFTEYFLGWGGGL